MKLGTNVIQSIHICMCLSCIFSLYFIVYKLSKKSLTILAMSLFGNTGGGGGLFGTSTPATTTAAPLFGGAPGNINFMTIFKL